MNTQISLISFVLGERYTLLQKMGEGTFASVHAAMDNDQGEKVAIKQIYVQKALLDQAMQEVNRLKNLQNDHIISYRNSFYDSQQFNLNLVMQLCHDSLRGQLLDKKVFQNRQLESFLLQMTCAFLELQNQNVMHLDLKPENILVGNKEGTYFKLCDFGCSQISSISRMSGYEQSAFGTFNYLAPEIHVNYEGKKTRNSADVWSLGVTLYEMIFWRLPFNKEANGIINRKEVQMYFTKNTYSINYVAGPDAPKQIIDIIKLMLKPMPTDRITWKKLKQHLILTLNIERHEFMNINDLIVNFLKIFELLLKTAFILKQGAQQTPSPFWKSQKVAAVQIYEEFVHYLHIVGSKFKQRTAYKWEIIPKNQRIAAQKLIDEAQEMQMVVCKRKQIKQFDINDFSYQECLALDQMKSFKSKIQSQGTLKGIMEFLNAVFTTLITIIEKSEGTFTRLEPFEPCFKIKV